VRWIQAFGGHNFSVCGKHARGERYMSVVAFVRFSRALQVEPVGTEIHH